MGFPTSYAPPPLVPGAPPSALPYDPSAPSVLTAPEEGSPAAAKLARDREMRSLYGALWSDAVAQSRNAKAASNSGKPHATAGNGHSAPEEQTPRMVQKAGNADRLEWFDHDLPLAADPSTKAKRAAGCNRTDNIWPHPECKARYVDEYKEIIERYMILSCELIGGGDPQCTCMNDVPVFVTCVDEYIGETLFDNPGYFEWPKQILDYRNITQMWNENSLQGSCTFSTHIDCPEPATGREDMFRQIDESLNHTKATRVYLNQTQLDDYLAWRKDKGAMNGFRYVRVSNRKPIERTEETKSEENGWDAYGKYIGLAVAGFIGLGASVYMVLDHLRTRARIRNIVATTTAPPATHTAPKVRTASPSSVASASATDIALPIKKKPKASNAMSQGMESSESSESSVVSSEDELDSTSIDISPAGQEDHA